MAAPVSTDVLFRPGENCCAVARARRVGLAIDAEAYFEAFMRAAERAERSILILAWDFDSRTGLAFGDDGRCRTTIGDFLNDLARRRRRLQVHILDWDYPMIFGADREFLPLYGLGWKRHRRVHFRFDDTHPLAGSHHQKIVDRDTVRRTAGRRLNRLTHALRERGLLAMTAVRLVPIAPFAVESVVAGAIRLRLWHVLGGTFFGMLPGTLTATIFGDQIETALKDPSLINWWLVGGVVLLLGVASYVVQRWFKKMERRGATGDAPPPQRTGARRAPSARAAAAPRA